MEIVLKRIAKQNTYTIGRMYILKDEEVERKVNYTLNKDQKRSLPTSTTWQKLRFWSLLSV